MKDMVSWMKIRLLLPIWGSVWVRIWLAAGLGLSGPVSFAQSGAQPAAAPPAGPVIAPYSAGVKDRVESQGSVDANYVQGGQAIYYKRAVENLSLQLQYYLKKVEYLDNQEYDE